MGWLEVQYYSRRVKVKGSTKSFVFGMVVGAVAYHIMMNAKTAPKK